MPPLALGAWLYSELDARTVDVILGVFGLAMEALIVAVGAFMLWHALK